jgi:hypothetical protein
MQHLAFASVRCPGFISRHHLIAARCRTNHQAAQNVVISVLEWPSSRLLVVGNSQGIQNGNQTGQESQEASEPNHLSHSSATAHTAPDCAAVLGTWRQLCSTMGRTSFSPQMTEVTLFSCPRRQACQLRLASNSPGMEAIRRENDNEMCTVAA